MSARRIRSWKRFDNRSANAAEPDPQLAGTGGRPKVSTRALAQVIERSSRIQGPAAQAYVARLRRAHPGASPAKIVAKLEKRFLSVVTASGAAVGAAATLPGIGTLAAWFAAAGEVVVFLEATALFVLALASVHAIPLDHRERRRALVLAVLVGDNTTAVADLLGPGRTQRRLGVGDHGLAAAAGDIVVELANAQIRRQTIRAETRRAHVWQAGADGYRRDHRRHRQSAGRQEARP
ncbi:membrane protein [Mycobacterium tuberculosis]|nr:membrane protein [Mycobacterium tuberculosis]